MTASMEAGFTLGFPHSTAARFRGRHFGEFHGGRFHHHGFNRGIVVVPALGGLWWGGGLDWPYYIRTKAITGTRLTPSLDSTAPTRRVTTPM